MASFTHLHTTHFTKAAGLGLLLTLSTVLAGCQDEDFGYDIADVRQSVYAKNFKEVFGDIDPNHNWSMAQNVKVNLFVPNAVGHRLRILTEAPTNRESIILYQGTMTEEQLSVNVDVVRGTHYLYIELSSSFGTYLVDGYYQINEVGNVEVNNMVTRAANTPPPACSLYTTTLTRWRREWSDIRMNEGDYRWDKGFVSYEDHLTTNSTSGWSLEGDNIKQIDLLDGSGVSIYGNHKSLQKCILFKNSGSSRTTTYNGDIKFPVEQAYIHIPLAIASANTGATFTVILTDNNGAEVTKWENISIPESEYHYNGFTIAFKDVKLHALGLSGEKSYRLKVQLNGNNQHMAVCGGFYIETAWGNYIYQENVTNGVVRYTDVRGGGVNIGVNQSIRNEKTYRNNAKGDEFEYRTYDVKSMSGKGEGLGYIGTFYMIGDGNGSAILEGTEKIKYRDQFPLYGLYKSTKDGSWKSSPFREGVNHIDPYFSDGQFTAGDFEMNKEAQIVTLGSMSGEVEYDGSVSIKLVGIGTGWSNDVGYFYYPKEQEASLMRTLPNGEKTLDFNKIPKVVIRKNMQTAIPSFDQPMDWNGQGDVPHANYAMNFFQFTRYVDGCYCLSLDAADAQSLINNSLFTYKDDDGNFKRKAFINQFMNASADVKKKVADATFDAPIYKLPYYGWNATDNKYLPTGSATYEWPKDMVIGFFGIRTDGNVAAELSRIYTSSASVERNYFNDLPRGSAFSYKGKNYIGLEDEWDYDNNDFLFEVQGVQSVNPDITPEDDKVETKNTQDWLIACEDLGGVWDYDFNDLVWAITKEVNTTTTIKYDGTTTEVGTTDIYFTPLAAGGTLDARVEYNTSIALAPNTQGWDDNAWISLGEIHKMVTRDEDAPTNVQVNVDPNDTWLSKERIGVRIKLGTTIPTKDDAISIASILSHFRIRVKQGDNEYVVANVHQNLPGSAIHNEHKPGLNFDGPANNIPQFILLPKGWAWPAEAVCITDVYGLQNWFQNQNETGWLDTWNNSKAGKTGKYIVSPI